MNWGKETIKKLTFDHFLDAIYEAFINGKIAREWSWMCKREYWLLMISAGYTMIGKPENGYGNLLFVDQGDSAFSETL